MPTDDTDYEDKISVHLKPISEDATMDESMNLVVDTWCKKGYSIGMDYITEKLLLEFHKMVDSNTECMNVQIK